MLEEGNQLQHKYSDRELDGLFDNMKAGIEQLHNDFSVVVEGRS